MIKYQTEEIFFALGQSKRRLMLEHLARRGTMPVSQLAASARISLPATLKHTALLEKSGLITRKKEGRVQECTINTKAFEEAAGWLTTQKAFWEQSFDRLERHINRRKK